MLSMAYIYSRSDMYSKSTTITAVITTFGVIQSLVISNCSSLVSITKSASIFGAILTLSFYACVGIRTHVFVHTHVYVHWYLCIHGPSSCTGLDVWSIETSNPSSPSPFLSLWQYLYCYISDVIFIFFFWTSGCSLRHTLPGSKLYPGYFIPDTYDFTYNTNFYDCLSS